MAGGLTDQLAVSIDPTRMLYRWEVEHRLDYAVLGALPSTIVPVLDAGVWHPGLINAYRASRIEGFSAPQVTPRVRPQVEVIAPGAVWRITEGNRRHLLRLESPSITVIDEAYGSRTVPIERLERVTLTRRRQYPALLIEADGVTYGLPLHDSGPDDDRLATMLSTAHQRGCPIELSVRRSPFWQMDGSVDEVEAVVDGVALLG